MAMADVNREVNKAAGKKETEDAEKKAAKSLYRNLTVLWKTEWRKSFGIPIRKS